MAEIKWENKHIEVSPPKKPKKCTGTRFGAVLGVNHWKTPFSAWCEITRTYEEPFVDTKYTIAGKTIEPKQADYVERSFGMDIIRPSDIYGEDVFHKTFGDFFPEQPIFGGMWDYLAKDENGKVDTVLEMKTSKRVEDWANGAIPEYYALQAALYAYLYGVDNVIMVASFLGEADYDHPDEYVPSIKNTILVPFKVSERYPNMSRMIKTAEAWWTQHVLTGISPDYDENADANILKALRVNKADADTDLEGLIQEAESLKTELDASEALLSDKEKRLKEITDKIKSAALERFRDGDKQVQFEGKTYQFAVSKQISTQIDKEALTKDGLIETYSKAVPSYRLTMRRI